MKKNLLFIVLCALISTATYGATLKRTYLLHDGNLTQYDANVWQQAITDAVAGDIVYFTAGMFEGDLVIDKAITLIGAGVGETEAFYYGSDIAGVYAGCGTSGESTYLNGNVTIAIPGSVTLTKPLMEGFRMHDYKFIKVTEPVTGLTIKRCQLTHESSIFAEETVTNFTLENCYSTKLDCRNMVNPTVRNCYLESIEYVPEVAQIRNSIIIWINYCTNCTFTNCGYESLQNSSYLTFVNCLYKNVDSNSSYTNCSQVDRPCTLTKAQLTENNYLGDDGTVIGTLGGTAPFTLIPSQPSVATDNITYNSSTKKLNVSLTVKQGK